MKQIRRKLASYLTNYFESTKTSREKFAGNLENFGGESVDGRTIYYWESGERDPKISNLIAISKILNVSVDELLKPDTDSLAKIYGLSLESKNLLKTLIENNGHVLFKISTTPIDWNIDFSKFYTWDNATSEYSEKLKKVFIRQRLKDFLKENSEKTLNPETLFNYINVTVECAEEDERMLTYPNGNRNVAYYATIASENLDFVNMVFCNEDGTPIAKEASHVDTLNVNKNKPTYEHNVNFDFLNISALPVTEQENELRKLNDYLDENFKKLFEELVKSNLVSLKKEKKCVVEFVDVSEDQRLENCVMDFVEISAQINLNRNEITQFLLYAYEEELNKKIQGDL